MGVRKFVFVSLVTLSAACSSARNVAPGDLSCGPGTAQVGEECLPLPPDAGPPGMAPDARPPDARLPDAAPADAGPHDAAPADAGAADAAPADAAPDAPPDADPAGSEATSFAVDPAHDNAQPTDTVASPLKPLWTATFSGTVYYPLVASGRVIVAVAESQPNVRALDIKTGAQLWGPIVFGMTPMLAYDRGRVFALDSHGNLAALDATTGAHVWSVTLQGEPFFDSPPVAAGGLVYVNGLGTGGMTIAVDEQTGTTRWSASTFDGSDGCVAVANRVVYEAEACDQLSAFDAASGASLWFHSGNCTGGGGAAPAVYDGLIWERDWAQGNIIIDSSGNSVGSFASSAIPAFHAGAVFYQNAGTVSAVDIASDTLRWSFTADNQICTSPVVAGGGGQVFVGSKSGNVYELDEATGSQRSVDQIGTPVTCFSEDHSMAVAEGHLLVPAGTKLVVY